MREAQEAVGRFDVDASVEREPAYTLCRATDRASGAPAFLLLLPQPAASRRMPAGPSRPEAAPPNPVLLATYEVGFGQGFSYVAFEYADGVRLRDACSGGRWLDLGEVVGWVGTLADALDACGARGAAYGLLNAENVLLASRGSVRLFPREVAREMANLRLGEDRLARNAASAAPEVIRGAAPDARSDVYSLGAVLFEALTGRPLYPGATLLETVNAAASAEEVAHERFAELPDEVASVLGRALAKNPASRFAGPRALAAAFVDAAARSAVRAAPPPPADVAASVAPPVELSERQSHEAVLEALPSDDEGAVAEARGADGPGEVVQVPSEAPSTSGRRERGGDVPAGSMLGLGVRASNVAPEASEASEQDTAEATAATGTRVRFVLGLLLALALFLAIGLLGYCAAPRLLR